MKKILYFLLLSFFALAACKDTATESTQGETASNRDKASYGLGVAIGSNLKKDNIQADIAELQSAIEAVFSDSDTRLSIEQVQPIVTQFLQDSTRSGNIQDVSYAIGLSIGTNFKSSNLGEVDLGLFQKGLNHAFDGTEYEIAETKIDSFIREYQKEVGTKAGSDFLAENAKKEGWKTTESGLQYKVVQEGTGKSPTAQSMVTVHYTGTLTDGTKFDSSVDRGEPATFNTSGVIAGWTEALQLMKEGGKLQLAIPYDLAYGEFGSPPVIPPFAALLFDVELIKVSQQAQVPTPQQ